MKQLTLACAVTLLVSAGCESSTPVTDPEKPHGEWTALQDFQMEGMMIIGQDASMGNWAAVRKGASSEEFKAAVEKFTASPLPAELETHKDVKTKVDQALNDMVATARSGGNPQQLEADFKQAQEGIAELKGKLEGQE